MATQPTGSLQWAQSRLIASPSIGGEIRTLIRRSLPTAFQVIGAQCNVTTLRPSRAACTTKRLIAESGTLEVICRV